MALLSRLWIRLVATEQDVPPVLGPWIPWALDGAEEKVCPAVKGAGVCLWPGRLALRLEGDMRRIVREDEEIRAGRRKLPRISDEHRPDGLMIPLLPRFQHVVHRHARHCDLGMIVRAQAPDAFLADRAEA